MREALGMIGGDTSRAKKTSNAEHLEIGPFANAKVLWSNYPASIQQPCALCWSAGACFQYLDAINF